MDSHQLEAFALAKDRAKALEQLIPGTEEHYFHACLVAEQKGDLKEVESLLAQWNKRHGETAQFQEIRNRVTLLKYEKDPKGTLEYLRYHLGLAFNHERQVEGRKTSHATALEAKAVSRDEIRKHGYSHSNSSDLAGFTDAALEWLAEEPLDGHRLRSFLSRLRRPDVAKLPELVAQELNDKRNSSGFGAIGIHNLMLEEQLEKLEKALPTLRNDENYVNARLVKFQPGFDVDWANDAAAREAFLTRQWDFVKGLSGKFNALKAHVLYHRLEHDRKAGVYDRARFMLYIQLPRAVSYMNSKYLEKFKRDEEPFGLGQDYHAFTLHAAVSNDDELVRDYLSHLFLAARDFKPFDDWIEREFLEEVFASAKMLAGAGDDAQWYAMVNNPSYVAALKERVEISFARTNRSWYRAKDAVTLEVDVKNVPTLVVKVFEINALNYFLATGRDVDTSIDLDGLVAGEEQTHTYADAPMRRVRRTFTFPALANPGVYIVELIGGGMSSRALIRKGRLRFLERVGAAGHAFTVLDEDRNILKDASIWLGGREYKPEADGAIHVPFSAAPGRQTMLLRHGGLTTIEQFDHQAESYQLFAGIYVDRESLVKKKEAQVVIRPSLQVNGVPAALSLLEEVALTIQSTDRDGVSSSSEVRGLKLAENEETAHTFQVPEGLATIAFTLRAKVQNLSQNKKVDLADSATFSINGIDAQAGIEDLHLARTDKGYVLHHAGKSGEARAGTAINFQFRHRDLVPILHITLQTDAAGRIELGHARDLTWISATAPSGVSENWTLPRDRAVQQTAIHVKAGEPFRVPMMDVAPLGAAGMTDAFGKNASPETALERRDASLLEFVGGSFRADHFKALSRRDGFLEVQDLPAGDYELLLKRDMTAITIRVAPGEERAGWIAADKRHIERRNPRPLQVSAVAVSKSDVKITIGHSHDRVRVHVFGTRFVPAHDAWGQLGRPPVPGARAVEVWKGLSHSVSGRDIGDEYRYILERRQSKTFAGTMLTRPGLLLNPWAIRSTETATQDAAAGGAYAASPPPSMAAPVQPRPRPQEPMQQAGSYANLDFLANPAAVLLNLRPDAKGVVTIPRDAVKHANMLRIVAVDAVNTVSRDIVLPEVTTPHEDLRLRLALDADKHFSEKKQITVLSPGQPLEIADITTSKTEVYDTLGRVFRLFATLSGNATLTEFGFILGWPRMTEDEKRAKFSEFACHELSFFIAKKDPEWFARVVKPYLKNKMHKTFLDHWLLENDLAGFRKPWAFGRLNIVERILLSQRFDDEGDPVARHVKDLNDLLPKDIERANHLFGSAILGSALEAGDALGIGAATTEAQKQEYAKLDASLSRMEMPMGRAGAAMAPASVASKSQRSASPHKEKLAKKAAPRDKDMDDEAEAPMEAMADMASGEDSFGGEEDRKVRGRMRQFYQKLDKTQEWAENNYWHLPIEQQLADLITVNPFWRDYAAHRKLGPFLSQNLAYASRNFPEMMFALAVLDLPFEADKPAVVFEGARMKLTGKARSVAFHKEIKPVEPAAERVPVLVSQNYFRDDDRTRYENDESVDKYVTGEFLVNVVYTCQVVLTNPTSTNQKLDLLLQIPTGAIPVRGGFYTKGRHVDLSSYNTESIEYAFYFAVPGTFRHFPAHVAKNEQLIASTEPTSLKVVSQLSTVDKTSWAWLSQNGSEPEVLKWLADNNADRLGPDGLEQIAWRVRDRGFYEKCLALLARRHIWHNTLWSYAIHHNDLPNLREFLLHQDHFLGQCGPWLQSPPVTLDPVERRRSQHLEYAPLVNARTHKLGARRTILNDRFAQQYQHLMSDLRYKANLSEEERLAVAYYLFLQDRLDEALALFDSLNPQSSTLNTRLQYDYLKVYAEFVREAPEQAKESAQRHKDHPVDRWRNLFRNALAQIDEIAGSAAKVTDDKDRDQRQSNLAATEPDFEFTVEKKQVAVSAQNLTAVRAHYYRMDIELLFSRQPFLQQQSNQFSFIRPNRSDDLRLAFPSTTFPLPPEFHGANVVVELAADGKRKSQAVYAHELAVQVVENYGQLRVAHQPTGKPLPKTYVKVYARMKGGEVKFYKDGYTDLRGAFDYTSLNTNELDYVDRFSVLVMSEKNGAMIRECGVPKR